MKKIEDLMHKYPTYVILVTLALGLIWVKLVDLIPIPNL